MEGVVVSLSRERGILQVEVGTPHHHHVLGVSVVGYVLFVCVFQSRRVERLRVLLLNNLNQ